MHHKLGEVNLLNVNLHTTNLPRLYGKSTKNLEPEGGFIIGWTDAISAALIVGITLLITGKMIFENGGFFFQ